MAMYPPFGLVFAAMVLGAVLCCKRSGSSSCHCDCSSHARQVEVLQQRVTELEQQLERSRHNLEIQQAQSEKRLGDCMGDMKSLRNVLEEQISENNKELQRLNLEAGEGRMLKRWNDWALNESEKIKEKAEKSQKEQEKRYDEMQFFHYRRCDELMMKMGQGGLLLVFLMVTGWVITHVTTQKTLIHAQTTNRAALGMAHSNARRNNQIEGRRNFIAGFLAGAQQKISNITDKFSSNKAITSGSEAEVRKGGPSGKTGGTITVMYPETEERLQTLVTKTVIPGLKDRKFTVKPHPITKAKQQTNDLHLVVFSVLEDGGQRKPRFCAIPHSTLTPLFLNSLADLWKNFP